LARRAGPGDWWHLGLLLGAVRAGHLALGPHRNALRAQRHPRRVLDAARPYPGARGGTGPYRRGRAQEGRGAGGDASGPGRAPARLQAEIAKGHVLISQQRGELVVDLIDKIVFDSGEAELNDAGKEVLRQVGETLA